MKKNLFFGIFFCCCSFYLNNSFAEPNLELTINDIDEETVSFQKKVKQPFEMKDFFKNNRGLLGFLFELDFISKYLSDKELFKIEKVISSFLLNDFCDLEKKYSVQPSDKVKIKSLIDYFQNCLEKIKEIRKELWIDAAISSLKLVDLGI